MSPVSPNTKLEMQSASGIVVAFFRIGALDAQLLHVHCRQVKAATELVQVL
jgi:hypothetical protein